jgi:capsular polysaccharide biosynthesis protein
MEKSELSKVDMKSFLHALRRFWLLIVLFSLVGGAVGWSLAVWRVKPQYKATALIFVSVEPNAAGDCEAGNSEVKKSGRADPFGN